MRKILQLSNRLKIPLSKASGKTRLHRIAQNLIVHACKSAAPRQRFFVGLNG